MKSLSHWNLIGFVLEYLSIRNLILPISPHDVFQSDQWLFGNIASLSAYLNISVSNNNYNINNDNNDNENIKNDNNKIVSNNKSIIGNDQKNLTHSIMNDVIEKDQIFPRNNQDNENISDEILITYLQLLIYFYCHCDVPGIVQGKKGIVWKKKVNELHFFHFFFNT